MSRTQKQENKAIPKTITIFPEHQKFIDDTSLNLSKFVQKKIDEEIETRRSANAKK